MKKPVLIAFLTFFSLYLPAQTNSTMAGLTGNWYLSIQSTNEAELVFEKE